MRLFIGKYPNKTFTYIHEGTFVGLLPIKQVFKGFEIYELEIGEETTSYKNEIGKFVAMFENTDTLYPLENILSAKAYKRNHLEAIILDLFLKELNQ